MSRRGFLRFLGVTAAIATVPSLIIPKQETFSEMHKESIDNNKYFEIYGIYDKNPTKLEMIKVKLENGRLIFQNTCKTCQI